MRARALAPLATALLAGATLAGSCGEILPADLFLVQRSGSVAGARLTLLVNEEGGVRCNGAEAGRLSDARLIEARAIKDDLDDPASEHLSLPARPGSVLTYDVRLEKGSVHFADNSSGQPQVLRRLALFVLRTAQERCHLAI